MARSDRDRARRAGNADLTIEATRLSVALRGASKPKQVAIKS